MGNLIKLRNAVNTPIETMEFSYLYNTSDAILSYGNNLFINSGYFAARTSDNTLDGKIVVGVRLFAIGTGKFTVGKASANRYAVTEKQVLAVYHEGIQNILFKNPITINTGEAIALCDPTDTVTFKFAGGAKATCCYLVGRGDEPKETSTMGVDYLVL